MKAEHRHELKTNELAEWLGNFPDWARKNAKTITYLVILFAVIAGLYFYKWYSKNVIALQKQVRFSNLVATLAPTKLKILSDRTQGTDTAFRLLEYADNLEAAAQEADTDNVAALALIKRGEIFRTELHYRLLQPSKNELENQLNRAKQSYTEAFLKASANPSLASQAKLGLGLCEEELGNFENAKQIYREIAAEADFQGTIAAAQAKLRLNTMTDYQKKVVFLPTIKPATTEIIQPQLQPIQPDENAPGQ